MLKIRLLPNRWKHGAGGPPAAPPAVDLPLPTTATATVATATVVAAGTTTVPPSPPSTPSPPTPALPPRAAATRSVGPLPRRALQARATDPLASACTTGTTDAVAWKATSSSGNLQDSCPGARLVGGGHRSSDARRVRGTREHPSRTRCALHAAAHVAADRARGGTGASLVSLGRPVGSVTPNTAASSLSAGLAGGQQAAGTAAEGGMVAQPWG